jgi:hypothetical protein
MVVNIIIIFIIIMIIIMPDDIWNSHSGAGEDASVRVWNAISSVIWIPTFRRSLLSSSSWWSP